jgi:hypothetical protein
VVSALAHEELHDDRPANRCGWRRRDGDQWTYFVLPEAWRTGFSQGSDRWRPGGGISPDDPSGVVAPRRWQRDGRLRRLFCESSWSRMCVAGLSGIEPLNVMPVHWVDDEFGQDRMRWQPEARAGVETMSRYFMSRLLHAARPIQHSPRATAHRSSRRPAEIINCVDSCTCHRTASSAIHRPSGARLLRRSHPPAPIRRRVDR